jgi:hypothetical protein
MDRTNKATTTAGPPFGSLRADSSGMTNKKSNSKNNFKGNGNPPFTMRL